MRRLLAVLAAAAMVAGALAIRNVIDDDPSAATVDTGVTADNGGDDARRVLCSTELEAACTVLGEAGFTVRVEPAGTTATALVAASPSDDPGFDVWLTARPWPAMVEEQRRLDLARPLLGESVELGARSPVVMVTLSDRAAVLDQTCGVSWSCVGDSVDSTWEALGGEASWGRIEPGHSPPGDDTEGLLTTAQLTADQLGFTDYASNDLDATFTTWLADLEGAVPDHSPPVGSPLDQLLLAPAFYDTVGSIEAVAAPAVASSRDRDRLTITIPEPVITADVVATAPLAGDGSAAVIADRDDVREALAAAGWRTDGGPAPETIDSTVTLPPSDNLPPAGVLIALTDRWNEVT